MRIPTTTRRRGSILPMLALCVFALFAFLAMAVDLGMLMVARTECQNAADTAALYGARTLNNAVTDNQWGGAQTNAIGATNKGGVKSNILLNTYFPFSDSTVDAVNVGVYDYNSTSQVFRPRFPAAASPTKLKDSQGNDLPWTAVKVTVKGDQPTYFARIFGVANMPMTASATAVHRPRDLAIILDFSGSMQFGSVTQWEPGTAGANGEARGLMNPDYRYPQFGHYQRYPSYQNTNPVVSAVNSAVALRPNPLQMTQSFLADSAVYSGGTDEVFAPNNQTITGSSGPAIADDFRTDPSNPTGSVNASNLVTSFTAASDSNILQDSATYNGDLYPRKGGVRYTTTVSWDPTTATGGAKNLAEMLFANGAYPGTPTARANPAGLTTANGKNFGSSWANFRDVAWETYGYDLDIPAYITSGYATATQLAAANRFKGYTTGPGHWGKTFFTWPPDPRAAYDWRRKFFTKSNGAAFDPQVDNINSLLLNTANGGQVLTGTTANYAVNYPAILAWIKSGPQTLPSNMRSGRILYYSAIPTDCTTPTTADQRFWRNYIDFVIGTTKNWVVYDPRYNLAGVEYKTWPEGATVSFTAPAQYKDPTSGTLNPFPSMSATDLPNRPRQHFWFGAATMISYLNSRGQTADQHNWWSGTSHEAQCWQLKAAMQSGIEDIRKNHPNDQCGLTFFAYNNFTTVRCPMGQQWDKLKASLFYPNSIVDAIVAGDTSTELRPCDTNVNPGDALVGNLPNANGGTDPNTGFAMAYNLLSSGTTVLPGTAGLGITTPPTGRRGATKIVIFETDGVPNSYQSWNFVANGYNSYYNRTGNGAGSTNGSSASIDPAVAIATQMAASTGGNGYSLANSPARIYSIAFGDLFSSNSGYKDDAYAFLQTIQSTGNALASPTTPLPPEQVITGAYQTRIDNLKTALQKILQSGVQVTLVE